jgi:hypothetical protein
LERLDEQRIDVLRRWGDGLSTDSREEVRAAGRAILILIEEIERLHVDLWNERSRAPAEPPPVVDQAAPSEELRATLRSRLAQLRRRPAAAEDADLSPANPQAGDSELSPANPHPGD